MRQVKVIDLCWAFYCCIESPVIGIVLHCKHNFYTFIYSKPESNIKNIKIYISSIRQKACLSPFLVTNWPQRQKIIFSTKILQHRISHDSSPRQRFHMKSRVQFKFPTPNAWGSNSPSNARGFPRGGGGGMLKLWFDRYITDTGTDFILDNTNACNQEASLVCEAHIWLLL